MLARVLPFALYILFLILAEVFGGDQAWLYPVKIGLVLTALLAFLPQYGELRVLPAQAAWLWLAAPAVGAVVFVAWINLDVGWLSLGSGAGYRPTGPDGGLIWSLAAVRLAGAAVVVPVMEELFWRAFLARWIDRSDFLALAPAALSLRAVLVSSVLFGVEHALWFAGILAGLAYTWLYRASGSLWPAILAHAVTNLMLGVWVLATGNWQFW
ncbi:CAAX prenyl protease-related protein [Parasulfuritortus cantonensis]|uniref:CAAX prenyl protease-related protein n=1 Tax=Parasulfuritortus cantonensis TaxID=2528202 RepID=A0A4R1BF68_9PROT|nr:CAAX prenyl protease-related protein [Parasulfuritortus cantonensis]